MMDDLNTLAGRVEAATGPDRELDAQIALAQPERFFDAGPRHKFTEEHDIGRIDADWRQSLPGNGPLTLVPAYTASIDAALTLVPVGWAIEISVDFVGGARATLFPQGNAYYGQVKALAATAALALCVAALRARAGGA